jgi:hypothetical protein
MKFAGSFFTEIGAWVGGFGILLALAIVLGAFLSSGGDERSVTRLMTTAEIETAVSGITRGFPEVLDAAISQEGDDLSLALIVGDATSEAHAKELGNSFVRMVKTFGPDYTPEQALGRGAYSYAIIVARPDGSPIVEGAKGRSGTRISWQETQPPA